MATTESTENSFLDGKVHRLTTASVDASIVAEYSPALDMQITYLRYDNGVIEVSGLNQETKESMHATLSPDGKVAIFNSNLATTGTVPEEQAPKYAKIITDLINEAFPKGASEIVPVSNRTGSYRNMLTLQGLKQDQLNFLAQGNGYLVTMVDGNASFQSLDANWEVKEALVALKSGGISYDNAKVPDEFEPVVPDENNKVANSSSKDGILLAGRVLSGGVIDPQEAAEIGAAMQRARLATTQELLGGDNTPVKRGNTI